VEVSNMYPSAQLTAMQAGFLDGGYIETQPMKRGLCRLGPGAPSPRPTRGTFLDPDRKTPVAASSGTPLGDDFTPGRAALPRPTF
jgi:hypothetical protein